MSVEIKVIPTVDGPFTWGTLRQLLRESELPVTSRCLLDNDIALIDTISGGQIAQERKFSLIGYYGINLGGRKSLELDVQANRDCEVIEGEYIDDFGDNLDADIRSNVADQWRRVGYSYSLISHPKRHPGELAVIVALSIAVARLCGGFIIVMNIGALPIPIGLYSLEQFEKFSTPVLSESGGLPRP